jgi:hypothetical protein
VTCEPVVGQHCLECPDAWRHVVELDPNQQGEFGDMKATVPALSKDDDLVPALLQERAPPPLPTHRLSAPLCWLTRQPVGRGQGKHHAGEQDLDLYRAPRFLGWMAQIPLRHGAVNGSRGVAEPHGFCRERPHPVRQRLPSRTRRATTRRIRATASRPGSARCTRRSTTAPRPRPNCWRPKGRCPTATWPTSVHRKLLSWRLYEG